MPTLIIKESVLVPGEVRIQKIPQIKVLRQLTREGLRESKTRIDNLINRGSPIRIELSPGASLAVLQDELLSVGLKYEIDYASDLYSGLDVALHAAVKINNLKVAHKLLHIIESL